MQKSTGTQIDSLLEVLNVSQLEFANKLDVTSGAITNWKKRKLGINVINKIVKAYPQISREWLMTGEGSPIKANQIVNEAFSPTGDEKRDRQLEKLSQITYTPKRTYNSRTGVPFYNVQFELGFDFMETDNRTNPDYMIDFQPYNKADCWCTSKGNSMHPTISGGDIIALKRIEDFHILMNNEIYGIITVNGLRTIKRVKDNGETLILIPDNKDGYDEQIIDKKDVMHVFQVLGCIKMF